MATISLSAYDSENEPFAGRSTARYCSEAVPNVFPTGTVPRGEIVQSQNGGLIA